MSSTENDSPPTNNSASAEAIDYSSPYYLHPSDHPGMVLVSQKLIGDNFPSWKRAAKIALAAKNKLCFVDGSLAKPNSPLGFVMAWECCNNMIISWLLNSMIADIANSVSYAETTREVWLDLEDRFSQGNGPRIYELKRSIVNTLQQQESVCAYYTALKTKWDELGSYTKIPTCTCGASKEFQALLHSERVHQFLMGLNDSFGTLKTQVLTMEPIPNINKVYALVQQEERQKSLQITNVAAGDAAALAASRGRYS